MPSTDVVDAVPLLPPSTMHALAMRYRGIFGSYEDAWQECLVLCLEIADEAPVVPDTTPPHIWLRWEVMSRLRLRARHWRSQGITETGHGTPRKGWSYNPLEPTRPLPPARAAECHELLTLLFDTHWPTFTTTDRDILRFLREEYDVLTRNWYAVYGKARHVKYDAVKRRVAMMRRRARALL